MSLSSIDRGGHHNEVSGIGQSAAREGKLGAGAGIIAIAMVGKNALGHVHFTRIWRMASAFSSAARASSSRAGV